MLGSLNDLLLLQFAKAVFFLPSYQCWLMLDFLTFGWYNVCKNLNIQEDRKMPEWSAKQYSKFKNERTLPAIDLANAIKHDNVRTALDVGCGIGNSTAVLKRRFPNAKIIGADNSDDMLKSARENYPELEFIKLDAEKDIPDISDRYDVVFSNACIQWIPDHRLLIKRLMGLLEENGVLALQIPLQDIHPMHKIIKSVAGSEKWAKKIPVPRIFYTLTEEEYFDILSELSGNFRMWVTTYFHAMPSHHSIVEWYKGSGLRPYLEQLDDGDKSEFEKDVLTETQKIYPVQQNGEIIFKFPRLFITAVK